MHIFTLKGLARCTLSVLLISPLGGCSGQLVSVEGRLTLDDKPVADATITFMPEAPGLQPATARSDADGRFHLETRAEQGAMRGPYVVVVSKYEMVEDPSNPLFRKMPNMPSEMRQALLVRKELLPPVYASFATTPLRVEVPSGGRQDVVIALNKK